jgi:hypothetical protein
VVLIYIQPASSSWLNSVIQVLNNIVMPSFNTWFIPWDTRR